MAKCKACPQLKTRLDTTTSQAQVLAEACKRLESELLDAKARELQLAEDNDRILESLRTQNAYLRSEFRAFLDSINWWKEELDGDGTA